MSYSPLSTLVLLLGLIGSGTSASAQTGAVKPDAQAILQDEADIREDDSNITAALRKIAQDRAIGSSEQLAHDKQTLKSARRDKVEAKKRLRLDRHKEKQDATNS